MSLNSHWFKNGQPSNLEKWKKVCFQYLERTFSCFQLWRLAIFEPVRVQRHNVPHLKGLITFYLDFEAQGRGSTFIFCHSHLKKAILLHKMASVQFDLNTAVLSTENYFHKLKGKCHPVPRWGDWCCAGVHAKFCNLYRQKGQ